MFDALQTIEGADMTCHHWNRVNIEDDRTELQLCAAPACNYANIFGVIGDYSIFLLRLNTKWTMMVHLLGK